MSVWNNIINNKEDVFFYLNERTKKSGDMTKKNNLEEMYFEDTTNNSKLRKSNIYLNCRNCFDKKMKPSRLYEQDEACRYYSFSFPKLLLGILLVVFLLNSVSDATIVTTTAASRGRWCQKVLTEETIKEVMETRSCSENYNTSCGFFSYDTCVFTRYKICTRIYNRTSIISKSIMDCCPGWGKKDNDTCVELARKSKSLPSIHELSIGTFAAICSAGAFIMVIVFFIVKAVWKKKRKEKAAVECVHLEQLESLNGAPRPQQVPLIPPQPLMANPHSLLPLKSSVLDDPDVDVEAAAGDTDAIETVVALPVENDQEVRIKMLEKIPETEELTATTVNPVPSLADGSDATSKENLELSEQPELQVELFIREEGDTSKPESQTQLQIQTLPENSNDSQDLQKDPEI